MRPKNNPPKTTQITPQTPVRPPIFPIRRNLLGNPLTNRQTIGA